jgi:hypothetical protein
MTPEALNNIAAKAGPALEQHYQRTPLSSFDDSGDGNHEYWAAEDLLMLWALGNTAGFNRAMTEWCIKAERLLTFANLRTSAATSADAPATETLITTEACS